MSESLEQLPETPKPEVNREAIEHRAYEISVERGGEPGHEEEDWLQAQREVSMKGAESLPVQTADEPQKLEEIRAPMELH